MDPVRKYRGTRSIVPIRETVTAAIRSGDRELIYEAEKLARQGGFVHLADEALAHLDRVCGTVRCKGCNQPGNTGLYAPYHCEVCRARSLAQSESLRKSPRQRRWRGIPSGSNRWCVQQSDPKNWPWLRTGRKPIRWTLQKAWEHLRGKIPDYNRVRYWTQDDFKLHDKLVSDELKLRRLRALVGEELKLRPFERSHD